MDPINRTTTGIDDVRRYHAEERLLDGRPVVLRAIRADDRDALRAGFHRLSDRSVYFRFFQAKRELSDAELSYLTEVDFESHVALVAMLEDEGGVGVGRYIVDPATGAAEIAFAVDDAHQGLGVGTLLLTHLARIARVKGIRELRAYVLLENRGMIEVFEHAGFPLRRRREGNTLVLTLELDLPAATSNE
jgi:GNAT superfamily N-acetyltransferase